MESIHTETKPKLKRIIWFKVAKTGGTALRSMFFKQIYKDQEYYQNKKKIIDTRDVVELDFLIIPNIFWLKYYQKKDPHIFKNALIISSIRDPVERYYSGCNHLKKNPNLLINDLPSQKKQPVLWFHTVSKISEYLQDFKIDYWIRQENLVEDLQKLADKLKDYDDRFDLKIVNQIYNQKEHRVQKLNQETREQLIEYFKEDYQLFNNVNKINQKFLKRKDKYFVRLN